MGGMQLGGLQWLLDTALIGLLAATLFHAIRLERALGMLKRDRAALEELVRGFNASTRQAEAGVERLRGAVDGAGRQIARQIEAAGALKADLVFLNERGEQLADRLDGLVRAGRKLPMPSHRVENDYARIPEYSRASDLPEPARAAAAEAEPAETRLRSQAERDLMKALRLAR
jgi:Domain of unknown function (DUF6468)